MEDEMPMPGFGKDGELGQPVAKKEEEEEFPPIDFGAKFIDVFKEKKESVFTEVLIGDASNMGVVWKTPDIKFEKGMHIRIKCKTPNCGAKLEGEVDKLLNDAAYKFKIECPKCRCEFSRGRQFHMQTDQVRGIVEMFRGLLLNQLHFEVELFWPVKSTGAVPGALMAGESPQEEWTTGDWSKLRG